MTLNRMDKTINIRQYILIIFLYEKFRIEYLLINLQEKKTSELSSFYFVIVSDFRASKML